MHVIEFLDGYGELALDSLTWFPLLTVFSLPSLVGLGLLLILPLAAGAWLDRMRRLLFGVLLVLLLVAATQPLSVLVLGFQGFDPVLMSSAPPLHFVVLVKLVLFAIWLHFLWTLVSGDLASTHDRPAVRTANILAWTLMAGGASFYFFLVNSWIYI